MDKVLKVNRGFVVVKAEDYRAVNEALKAAGNEVKPANARLYHAVGAYLYDAVSKAVNKRLNELMLTGKYDFMDNYRYCLSDHEESEKAFKLAEMNGCCGSYTEEIEVCVDDPSYSQGYSVNYIKFGFNYGH